MVPEALSLRTRKAKLKNPPRTRLPFHFNKPNKNNCGRQLFPMEVFAAKTVCLCLMIERLRFFFPLSPRRAKAALIKRYTGKFSLHEPLSSTCHRLAVPTLQLWLAVRAYGWRVMWRGGWRKKKLQNKIDKEGKKNLSHIHKFNLN